MSGAVKFKRDVQRYKQAFLAGTVLYIDPASGGTSQPGWAYTEGGVLIDSGVLQLVKSDIATRLLDLFAQLSYPQFKYGAPDLLVIEELRGRMVHPYLHWSAGVSVTAIDAEAVLEIPIVCWKAFAAADPEYTKSDEEDARAFAHTCLALARGERPPERVAGRVGSSHRAAAAARRKRTKRKSTTRTSRVRAPKGASKGARVRPARGAK